jgi:hypothetical protein
MSNYSPRTKRRVGYNVQRAVAPARDPAPAVPLPREAPAIADVTLRGRNGKAVNHLLSSTIDWLASLPPSARPLALATRYPRIANRIAHEWKEPSACQKDFDDLVYDTRGKRRGFPLDVHRELLILRDYYYGFDLELAKEA